MEVPIREKDVWKYCTAATGQLYVTTIIAPIDEPVLKLLQESFAPCSVSGTNLLFRIKMADYLLLSFNMQFCSYLPLEKTASNMKLTSSSAIAERPRCRVGQFWPKVEDHILQTSWVIYLQPL